MFPYHYGSHATWKLWRKFHQFKYVSIPLWFSRNKGLSLLSSAVARRFHTTMVLTQRQEPILIFHILIVSIPLWFSRNCLRTLRLSWRAKMFPYHYGSHATKRLWHGSWIWNRFHTTMVLTQHSQGSRRLKQAFLFPYHYGSHATSLWKHSLKTTVKFPYHYGSHATESVRRENLVVYEFPYHYGSHATRIFASNCCNFGVSIPLWFSRNLCVYLY